MNTLRLATRGSALAMAQTRWVAARLEAAHPGLSVTWDVFRTTGDATQAAGTPMADVGSKGLFTKELEDALLDGRADVAVHSLKDVPTDLPPGLTLLAMPWREDPRDALLCPGSPSFAALPAGARVGTSSLRRTAQLRRARPDLIFLPVRGNVDTRLRKLAEGQYDALIMAAAGLHRLGLTGQITEYLSPSLCLPAVGQGALAREGRAGAARIRARCAARGAAAGEPAQDPAGPALRRLTDSGLVPAADAVGIPGAAPPQGGSCQVPVAAFCEEKHGALWLRGLVAAVDGSELIAGDAAGADPPRLGAGLAEGLLARGAERLVRQAHDAR